MPISLLRYFLIVRRDKNVVKQFALLGEMNCVTNQCSFTNFREILSGNTLAATTGRYYSERRNPLRHPVSL